jgi:oligo-1,6-glucosidase
VHIDDERYDDYLDEHGVELHDKVADHPDSVLIYGDYELLAPEDDALYAYTRTIGDDRRLIALNWSDTAIERSLASAVGEETGDVLLGNYDDPGTDLSSLSLAPYEARVYRL